VCVLLFAVFFKQLMSFNFGFLLYPTLKSLFVSHISQIDLLAHPIPLLTQ
jgi:hypothetical protein